MEEIKKQIFVNGNMSSTIAELATALSVAQGQFSNAKKDAKNPFFKSSYADLASIVDVIRPVLTANGLAVTQLVLPDENCATLETLLIHKSGEWIKSTIKLKPTRNDPQGMGSAITYARRYALSAIVCIATEEDDDGNKASAKAPLIAKDDGLPTTAVEKELMTATQNKKIKELIASKGITMDGFIDYIVEEYKKEPKELTKIEADKLIVEMNKPEFKVNKELTK